MTLYQLNSLDEMEQMEAIRAGTEIGERIEDGYKITLVQIDCSIPALIHCFISLPRAQIIKFPDAVSDGFVCWIGGTSPSYEVRKK
jgi:hypothetical protein